MKKLISLVALVLLCASAQTAFSQQSNKDLVIQAARAMETAPASPETARLTSPALKWLIETEDVHLIVCGNVIGPMLEKKNKNGTAMIGAYTIGMGAFKIQNPDRANDEDAAQLAGVELALKVYEILVKEKPKTKFDPVEQLIAKRNSGELAASVKSAACGKK
ncbi:MAG: hypothetical protein ACK4S4_08335 [Pyrinomonadaceae bacterium]